MIFLITFHDFILVEQNMEHPWIIVNQQHTIKYDGHQIEDAPTSNKRRIGKGTLIRAAQPISKYSCQHYFEFTVVKEGENNEFLIGMLKQEKQFEVDGIAGWYDDAIGIHKTNEFGYSFQFDKTKLDSTMKMKLKLNDTIGCLFKRTVKKAKTKLTCHFVKNRIMLKKPAFTLDEGIYFPIIGINSPGAIIIPNVGEREFKFDLEGMFKLHLSKYHK